MTKKRKTARITVRSPRAELITDPNRKAEIEERLSKLKCKFEWDA